MNRERFNAVTSRYERLRIVVVGDYCLDRYLEIDPAREETSIETGLPVHNVVRVRAQPGGAGTILNNLAALGAGEIWAVGFCGDDGEGYELRRELGAMRNVRLEDFIMSGECRTFTYCKPLVVEAGKAPVELSRLDSKNWGATPGAVVERMAAGLREVAPRADAVVVLDQVDVGETGAVTRRLLEVIGELAELYPGVPFIGDSRRGLRGWPRVSLKMNGAELGAMMGGGGFAEDIEAVKAAARKLAGRKGSSVFVTLAERGIVGADADGRVEYVEALPVRGAIDVVGAGDSVTANLAAALAGGGTMREAMEMAILASSIVIHQLGTTGTAGVEDLRRLL